MKSSIISNLFIGKVEVSRNEPLHFNQNADETSKTPYRGCGGEGGRNNKKNRKLCLDDPKPLCVFVT